LTFWLKPGRKLIGLIMAFGAGTLISAIAYELVEDAAASGRSVLLTAGLALGAVAFFIGDWWVDRAGGEHRKRSGGEQAQGNSFGIFIGTLLDGIPESFILGASLVTGGGLAEAAYPWHLVGRGGGERLCADFANVARRRIGASVCRRSVADDAHRFDGSGSI
jgi:hypothetical protein